MAKRFATPAEIAAAPVLAVNILNTAHKSDTISGGPRPEMYTAADLKKIAREASLRTVEFERRLVAIWQHIGEPVPFLFRTADGGLRSLDAGCLGYLANRTSPDVALITTEDFVTAVVPAAKLVARCVMRAGTPMIAPLSSHQP